ncbi:MAG: hypothetical protein R3244_11490 [Thermoanaerobaculia bacterium]|nr:hypothetical protein [Thermoanaerobaculia bacterium]
MTSPEEAAAQSEPAAAAEDSDPDEVAEESEARDPFVEPNPCDVTPEGERGVLDKTRSMLFEAVCKSGRWFDDFFGDEPYWMSARHTWGRFGLRLIGEEHEGLDHDVTFSANLHLPNLENKVNLFLRREEEEQFVADPDRSVRLVPALFQNRAEREWVLGAGYNPMGGASKGIDFDGGVELRLPLEPYVRARYRHYWIFGETLLLRSMQSAYWRNQRGFGSSINTDVERSLGEDYLLRFTNFAAIDQSTYGVDWRSGLILFQSIGFDRALAYQIAVEGETDARIPVERWAGEVTYRQRMFREWFFGELLAGVAFIHPEIGSPREASFYLGVGFELEFAFDE